MNQSLDILIFGAHPDDAEIGMGGTIYKHTLAGYRIGICDLTYAEMSSNGDVNTRQQEANAANEVLNLTVRSNLGLPDRGLQLVSEQIDKITLEIRKYQPKIVFSPFWIDRHPDHVMCSKMVDEAIFNAKLRNYLPEYSPWKVEKNYYYFINDIQDADMMVDISSVYEQKKSALQAYRSQFQQVGSAPGIVNTPLNQGYLQNVEARDRLLGQKSNSAYAEGFISKAPYLVELF
ncbi:bacillithiol biosynthesis deacetylase BshB1 [Chengkuizengella axinellae]|uniref:Bacillithiol biosynthesis deacetylase BshB1 n=1 Tax=Chengkuizengella axinellae TaxID=3064388 RepID=A0ABT9IWV1_9BACL|nr:bacillithiol biosynthesis deacetylase BshB1 [Chengkuizengella sp. 2205SS18-9]MDP5273832.1 bacillithiol biosynthesis deacetylase BshB1 [Chengkuizengella sp. 2205SS18-9]